jgi:hypothetical protein
MSRSSLSLILAALLCGSGSAFLFAVTVPLFDQIVAALAAGLANAVFAALAIAVSAMTVLAAGLVVADLRSDLEAARDWQSINSQLILSDQPYDAGTAGNDGPYATLPQDDRVRHFFPAQRLAIRKLDRGEANARVGKAERPDNPVVPDVTSTSMDGQRINDATPLGAISRSCTPRLITDNAKFRHWKRIGIDQGRSTVRRTKERLVANAGRWQQWGPHQSQLPANSGNTADVIVLNARTQQSDSPAVSLPSLKSVEPPEMSCRGPPALRRGPLDPERDQIGHHHDLMVSDNFGDPVPVGVAELDVIETFLGDVLSDFLTASGGSKVRQTA